MLKYLYPNIDWSYIKVVGFDMDGTLYDEFELIKQVYKPISKYLANVCCGKQLDIYMWMIRRWLKKGSSYNFIFDEVLKNYGIEQNKRKYVISKCLEMFRNYKPNIVLPARSSFLLDFFAERFELFLVTDGSVSLQLAKIKALGLQKWFKPENIVITGNLGMQYYKPSLLSIGKIKALYEIVNPYEVVYLGDRDVDFKFASYAKFQFVYVKCMHPIESNLDL